MASGSDGTDRRVRDIIDHDANGARRGLSEGRMPKPELLDQESLRTQHVSRLLRAHERGDRTSPGTVEVSYERDIGRGEYAPCFR